ncbi:type III secretion system export apparatus subunit SctT [Erwinia pyrifoliae]|uniref:Type III secretion system export apparatus subunit SctT n=1 Tax=Erwinia pyrifoliae TaxID=79967 RepID=A0ABY5XDN2_ERWPY|nr:type III secretion system export apparatus subunit SctT [Erwinia pyrifoliae]AUX72542.1 EscT/YscT/HrcT family type III secretion system export apparatus protein [Erwinia pyrifoliae]MCA8877204.1 EscT/YscT/HrcT family type III secretion system export apparatus protein [Erwinia pyrifoliae]MCT2387387.1 type III secretion system export apparatus subunit SctT [Erwinia pyrifoliae]MCU8587013.1 type III secretion system export apparatus subunit SctT [Erwinia pyrifoliae]UWS30880.1 type III secretion s
MLFISLYFNFQHYLLIYAIAYARLAVVFYMLPILGERILSHLIIKNSIITLTIIGLWPCFENVAIIERGWYLLLVQECIVGLILATVLCLPFWIVIGLGEILDNQRGASMADNIDPLNGGQNSILAGLLNFTFGMIFFTNNGMRLLMEAFVESYHIFPTSSKWLGFHWQEAGRILVMLIESGIMLAAPVIIVMMVAEILLGVFARYCPQLNPFSLSLTIKSFITFITFLFYGFNALAEKPLNLFSTGIFKEFFPGL